MTNCEHCPLGGSDLTCPRWPTDHATYCNWVDPAHPNFKANGAAALMRIAGAASAPAPAISPMGEKPAEEPGPVRKAVTLARAVAGHVAAGLPMADAATHAHRVATCRECPHHDARRDVCKVCGCSGVKLTWRDQKCPKGKW